MEEHMYRFASFRIAEQEELTDDAPPSVICKALEDANIQYEMVVSELDSSEASEDNDTSDLYPNGPASGPAFVMLYDFITTKGNFEQASAIVKNHPWQPKSQ